MAIHPAEEDILFLPWILYTWLKFLL